MLLKSYNSFHRLYNSKQTAINHLFTLQISLIYDKIYLNVFFNKSAYIQRATSEKDNKNI